jgi:hypothetical protein
MRRTISVTFLLFAFCIASPAEMIVSLITPQEARETLNGFRPGPEMQSLQIEYRSVIKTLPFATQA